jgi:predicted RNA binding protein YcfA (HicA-like mRNA interferase family)
MKTRKLKYGELRKVLVGLGFSEQATKSNHLVYRHPGSRLPVFLPRMRDSAVVEPIEILSLRNALENAGFWDSLVRQTGTESPAERIHVLQTLAGIKNGKHVGEPGA